MPTQAVKRELAKKVMEEMNNRGPARETVLLASRCWSCSCEPGTQFSACSGRERGWAGWGPRSEGARGIA